MSAPTSPAQQRPKRTRKSIAHLPGGGVSFGQENGQQKGQEDARGSKKLRSKSLGPGGLEALREGNGNKQRAMPVIRSILKPTIPLSPPKPIPPRTPKTTSPRKSLSSVSPSRRSTRRTTASPRSPRKEGTDSAAVEAQATLIALRTEQDQQRAARERERQEAIKRRDERRKSLANRRVSFAPEATLHTWDVVEMNEDATTSSEATNSTRRHSAGNTLTLGFTHGTQHASNPELDSPSTPPAQESDGSSPARQRDVHQKKRRRSSTLAQTDNHDPLSSSPTSSMADDTTQQSFVSEGPEEEEEEDEDDDISETDTYRDDESTAMDIEQDEVDDDNTGRTDGSMRTDETSSSSSSGQLDARLRAAIEQASTQNIDPQGFQQLQENEDLIDLDYATDKENQAVVEDEEDDNGMEMTEAVGAILPDQPSSPFETLSNEQLFRRQSNRSARRRSSGASTNMDETMDFTAAVGVIRRTSTASRRESGATVATEDEDMSMELTNVVGGLVRVPEIDERDENDGHDFQPDLTAQMDMTTVYGRILSPVTERTEPSTEASETMDFTTAVGAIQQSEGQQREEPEDSTATMTMDVTRAIGSILPDELRASDRSMGKMLMEEEAEHGQLTKSPFAAEPSYPALPIVADSSSLRRSLRKTTTPSKSPDTHLSTPKSHGRQTTAEHTTTPTHQMTPQLVARPTTPSKTPPNKNIAMRRTSPRKLFSQSTRERPGTASPANVISTSAEKNRRRATVHAGRLPEVTSTPTIQPLPPTMLGQPGTGSPLVAELLDRRASIGNSAETFTPQGPASRGVHFQDPREIEQEIDHDREEDALRESGREALEREADLEHEDRDTTMSLRDMIQSLTPKRKKDLKGRKSLAVGSALGLLGKRPLELDDEFEDDSPKRLQGPDRSPVKSIKLPAPPSKQETTGRLGRLGRVSLGPVSANIGTPTTSSTPFGKATTPKDQARFRAASIDVNTAPPVSFNQRDRGISPEPQREGEEVEAVQLQDFLNLIGIRFVDLETTKRRHTIVAENRTSSDNLADDRSLESCFVAGVSTVPMLELYQHSCRELKKYISEGRSVVREIEEETQEENPALFQEYLSATPEMRAIMDNQFKNVKAHARLHSRQTWYEWRTRLVEGLRGGLAKISSSLTDDAKSLSKQELLLGDFVSEMTTEHQKLTADEERLRNHAEELASCDLEELKETRDRLRAADQRFEEKQQMLAELRAQKQAQDVESARLANRKQQCMSEIESSTKLSGEYRGWKAAEVSVLKAEVDELERKSGWAVATASDGHLTLTYRKTLSLYLNSASFQPASSAPSPMSLSLAGGAEPSTQQRFFLQLLRARLHALDQPSTPLRDVLGLVSRGWDLAGRLQTSISDLTLAYITDVAITGDESIAVTAGILLRHMRTRVLARFDLRVGDDSGHQPVDFHVSTTTTVKVVYGEDLKEDNMGKFLAQKIGQPEADAEGGDAKVIESNAAGLAKWTDAVKELENKLIARGKKDKSG